jgi:uncharacterized membrane-anchored protein YitT (DUF2179 family)
MIESVNWKKTLVEYLQISVGAVIMAVGIYFFFVPHYLVVGGVSGLGIIILHYTSDWVFPIPLWLTNLTFNVPLLLIASRVIGLKFITRTVYAALFTSLAMFFLEYIPNPIQTDMFLAAVFGGVICGVGVAITYRNNATTGGSVLLATLIQRIIKHIPMTRILMVLDWAIILMGLFVFGTERTMYALISIFVCTKAMEYVLEGLHFSKAVFIISNDADWIGIAITEKMERGVTSLDGHGVYTGQAKSVLLCVVAKREIVQLKEVVSEMDKNAFVIVTDVREVLGQGFKSMCDKT